MMAVTSLLLKMGTALLTERFIKGLVVQVLELIVKRTETEEDDRLLAAAKREWGL
jgi:hypothetical protein